MPWYIILDSEQSKGSSLTMMLITLFFFLFIYIFRVVIRVVQKFYQGT